MFVSEILEEVKEVLGRCDEGKAFSRLTNAIQALQDEGDWNANIGIADIRAAIDGGRIISLPREVETPMAVAVNCRPAFMRDEFYEFHLNGDGIEEKGVSWAWDDRGLSPTFMDIVTASELVAVSSLASDAGKLIRVLGKDDGGRELRMQLEDGAWVDGLMVPINTLGDFPGGVISPFGANLFYRLFNPTPMTNLLSAEQHHLVTGALMQLAITSGTVASPLVNSNFYYVRSVDALRVSLHTSRLDASTGQSPVVITNVTNPAELALTETRGASVRTKFQSATAITLADLSQVVIEASTLPAGVAAATPYFIKNEGSNSFSIYETQALAEAGESPINVSTEGSGITARALLRADPYTTLSFSVNHDMSTGDSVTVRNSGGALPDPLIAETAYYVRKLTATSMQLHATSSDATAGLNPIVLTTSGSGTNAIVKLVPATVVTGTSSQVTASGHGLSDGSFVQFSSTGTLPAPIVQGTVYTCKTPLTADTFTLKAANGTDTVDITAVGSGSLFVNVSRAFSVGFTNAWRVETDGRTTGNAVRFFNSTGALPVTSPAIDSATTYYLRVLSADSVEIYTTLAYAINLAATTGRVAVTSVGSGALFVSIDYAVTAVIRDSYLDLEYNGFISNLSPIQFTTDGSLPSPLLVGTNYLASIGENGKLSVLTTSGVAVTITTIGSGLHELKITRSLTVEPSTSLDVPASEFATGDGVEFISSGTLPSQLAEDTTYYLRNTGSASVEVYAQHAQAIDLESTDGRLQLMDIGAGTHKIQQQRDPVMVASVSGIEKPVTSGFVNLYAWDDGNIANLTLLADMHPQDTFPQYRRIRVGADCALVRMKYRRKSFKITSSRDFINLDSAMAITMMVKSQDLLRKNFFEESERYRKRAVEYMNNRNRALDGPRTSNLQINADVTTCPDDVMAD